MKKNLLIALLALLLAGHNAFRQNVPDVYVAGYERNARGNNIAILLKNGTVQNLSDGSYNAYAYSVFVAGSDAYVAGCEENEQRKNVATLWKNGAVQKLSGGVSNARTQSVFVK